MEGFLLWPVPQATRNAQRKSQLRSHGDFKECIVTWTRLPRAEPEMFILVFNDPENQKGEGGWHPICGAPSASCQRKLESACETNNMAFSILCSPHEYIYFVADQIFASNQVQELVETRKRTFTPAHVKQFYFNPFLQQDCSFCVLRWFVRRLCFLASKQSTQDLAASRKDMKVAKLLCTCHVRMPNGGGSWK